MRHGPPLSAPDSPQPPRPPLLARRRDARVRRRTGPDADRIPLGGQGPFTADERAAMKERAKELKAEARADKDRAEGESDVLAKIDPVTYKAQLDQATPRLHQRTPAVALCGPVSSVKEQTVPHYAQRLADAGYTALELMAQAELCIPSIATGHLEDMRLLVDVNVWGVVHGCRSFLPVLRVQDEAHIVNVSSMAAFQGVPEHAVVAQISAGEGVKWLPSRMSKTS